MLRIRKFIQHKIAVHVLNHALGGGDVVDWNSREVTKRLIPLLEYDDRHHQYLPLSDEQSDKIVALNRSDDIDSALKTAQFLFHHYVTLYLHSYNISKDEISASAMSYLAHLDLNIAPMSDEDKLMWSLLIDMP